MVHRRVMDTAHQGDEEMKLYLKVTDDQYELPVAVAETQGELARMCGVSKATITSSLSHQRHGRWQSHYKEVKVEDEEEGVNEWI